MMLGEITPLIIGLLLGVLLGTQLSAPLSKRTVALLLGLSIVAAFLFGAPVFTWSIYGGYILPGLSFATPFIGAMVGLLIGKALRGGR
ncbi:MAG: hypothetical protein FJZ49_07245 [Candidatus Verstraetearchaeota archaeon]|nr:hypothetical protein [Candidatus Verstraetearchaeota archaeon]